MKLRIRKRWRTPRKTEKQPLTNHTLPAEHTASSEQAPGAKQTASAQCPNSANPRTLGNPYGRLFTNDRKFSDLLTKNNPPQAGETPRAQNAATAADRAANTALTAPEKQGK